MNTGFYKDLDTNFEQALIMCEKEFSHCELLEMLFNGNIPEKQIAALKFDKVSDANDAKALICNLTGCDGKIREAVASKINKLVSTLPDCQKYFATSDYAKIFAAATIDINANICRHIVDTASCLQKFNDFDKTYNEYIVTYTLDALNELDNFIFRDKKYVINKQLFKLYWCLEAIKIFYKRIEKNTLTEILNRSSKQKEYTIREKVAEIIKNDKSPELNTLVEELKNDDNYYVRNVFLKHFC